MLLVSFYVLWIFFWFFFWIFFEFFLNLFFEFFKYILGYFFHFLVFDLFIKIEEPLDVVFICPWSAHDQPVIYRAPLQNPPKILYLWIFFDFPKVAKNRRKRKEKVVFCVIFVNKNRVFLEAKFPKMHYKNHHFLYDKCSTFSLKNRT